MSLTPEEQAELAALEAEFAAAPDWKAKSQRKQDLVREGVAAEMEAEGPSRGEKAASMAMGAANALAPDTSDLGVAQAVAMGPVGYPTVLLRLLRDVSGSTEATKEAREQAPEAFVAGDLGGTVVNVATGAPSAAKGAAAAGKFAANTVPKFLRALVDKGGSAVKEAAKGAAENAAEKVVGERGLKAVRAALDDAKKPAPEPDPAKYTGEPIWNPAPVKPKVKFTEPVDEVKPKSPLREVADDVQVIRKEDVGVDAPKSKPGETMWVAGKPVDLASVKPPSADEFFAAEAARMAREQDEYRALARRAWESMPLSPVGQVKPAMMSTEALRAEARAAVEAGESLADLAARLGLKKTDRELVAVFKAAQIGH